MAKTAKSKRYRCNSCGNLTRFTVTKSRKTKAYHHYTVGGELNIDEETVLQHTINSVECRWCGPVGVVETLTEDEAEAEDASAS